MVGEVGATDCNRLSRDILPRMGRPHFHCWGRCKGKVLMARIRTIKPEFPQSESMGNVSRDARLTFILLWTIADDYGKLRGNSRMLASILFPYDGDAGKLIDKWLSELEREGCICRYTREGTSYVQVLHWQLHQRVDKPTASKIPDPPEDSRGLASIREGSCEDQRKGPEEGIKEGRGVVGRASGEADPGATAKAASTRGTRLASDWRLPSEWGQWALQQGMTRDAILREEEKFRDFWISKSGSAATKTDWSATWRNWIRKHLEEYAK